VTHTNIKSTIWGPNESDGCALMEVGDDRVVDMETDLDDVDKEKKHKGSLDLFEVFRGLKLHLFEDFRPLK
jgi:hypothetical protein